MKTPIGIAAVAAFFVAASGPAAVVTERWGVSGHVQHPDTLHYEPQGELGTLMRFDLSALPQGATVYRARLFFKRPGLYGRGFRVVAVRRQSEAGRTELEAVNEPLALVPPCFQWFDATAAVRAWVESGHKTAMFLLGQAPEFQREATCLEIAYEGSLRSPPEQVSGVRAFCRSGQVFISFREIEDYAGGKEEATWSELFKRFRDIDHTGPIPRDDEREVRYRVYAHDRPITPATIGQAQLLAEVVPGSMYNTRLVPGGDFIKRRPEAVALRLAIEPGKPLPPGSGLYVHTVREPGKRHYAVVTAMNGVENTVALSPENTAGPIDERPGSIEPVLQAVPKAHGHLGAGQTALRDGATYREDWYSYWAVPPCAPCPTRYDFAVGYCPEKLARPAPLTFTRGHTWNPNPEMPRPEPRDGVVMSMSTDNPNGFWTGINDARDTLKGIEEGVWQPFTQNRQEALIDWARRQFEIDPQRIVAAVGAWGMWEIKRGSLYACIHGWGMPEVTKGFQCWNWARGAWGPPEAYRAKPNDQNPFYLQDYTRWILEHPQTELPYFHVHTGWGAHFTEMGWPPFPRFIRAMIDTKRAFTMQPADALRKALADGTMKLRRDQSLPAFGNCSLDDNLGSGELRTGTAFGQVNGYLLWDTESIVDEPGRWSVTVWLDPAAPLPECTVDLTPRRCQQFGAGPGEQFRWTSTDVDSGGVLASGTAAADQWKLVTIHRLAVSTNKQRIRVFK